MFKDKAVARAHAILTLTSNVYYYALVGRATGHTVVGLCICLCVYLSVCRQDLSLLAKNVQHKLKSIFA